MSEWTVSSSLFTRSRPQRRTWLTRRCCPSCCTGRRPGSGETRPIEAIRAAAPRAKDFTHRRYRHRGVVDEIERQKNRTKSRVRSKGEHPIGVLKRVFGFAKVCYRGLAKNANRLFVACALANLYMVRHRLLRLQEA